MTGIPKVVTHNYHPKRGPFRNICDLAHAEADAILMEIAASGSRIIKSDYLSRRRATEEWLLSEKKRKLGPTHLERPIYFFLGDFADGRDPSRPVSVVLPLAALPPEVITFTYPDSMASFAIAMRDDHIAQRKDYHGQVFTLHEIEDVISRHGMPGERWRDEPSMRYERFVEVQVWDDRPMARFLATSDAKPGTARAGCALRGDAPGRTAGSA